LVVINDFYPICVPVLPNKKDAPLVVNPDAVPAVEVPFHGLQAVAWRRKKITQRPGSVKVLQLASCCLLYFRRQSAGSFAKEDSTGFFARESDHHFPSIIAWRYYFKRASPLTSEGEVWQNGSRFLLTRSFLVSSACAG